MADAPLPELLTADASTPDAPVFTAPAAVLLLAGRGSRLGPLSARRPKCLTPLAGRPLLDWQRDALAAAGLSRRWLIVGHRAECIVPQPGETLLAGCPEGGPIDSLWQLPAGELQRGFLMSYGDIVYRPQVVDAVQRAGGDIVIAADRQWHALWSLRFDDPLADAERFRWDGRRVLAIGGRAARADDIEAQFIGLLKCSSRGVALLGALRRAGDDTTRLLARAIDAGVAVYAVGIDGGWCEVDSRSDLARYRVRLRARARWTHDWRPFA